MITNRLLTNIDREHYSKLIDKMTELVPDMMSRKIVLANVQQAFILDAVGEEMSTYPGKEILCIGSFEDTASACLAEFDAEVVNIDPSTNYDLHTFKQMFMGYEYGIIFSTSVIEHVPDDEEFIQDICDMLEPGGLAVLTCDYNNSYKVGDKLPYSDLRFYTENDLKFRLGKIVHKNNCDFIDTPDWSGEPDFTHDGCNYSFATFIFRKASE